MRRLFLFIFLVIFINSRLLAKPVTNPRKRRNAVKDDHRLWPNGIMIYKIGDEFSVDERKVIEDAMLDIESVNCIQFRKHINETAYVEILIGKRCRIPIGYNGHRRNLTLNRKCITRSKMIHILLHPLGFYHEHNRPDRDQYVTVHEDNIDPSMFRSFKKKSPSDVRTLGQYDFDSILHYKDKAAAIDGSKKTLESKGNDVIGKAEEMSDLDKKKLIKLYNCSEDHTTDDYSDYTLLAPPSS